MTRRKAHKSNFIGLIRKPKREQRKKSWDRELRFWMIILVCSLGIAVATLGVKYLFDAVGMAGAPSVKKDKRISTENFIQREEKRTKPQE